MWILSNFDTFIFLIVLSLAILPSLKVCIFLYSLIKLIIKTRKNYYRWKNGIITLEDLHHLTPREFQYWCGEFVKKLGYTDITYSNNGTDDGKDIICKKFGETVYIECKRYKYSSSAALKVDDKICKKLIGTMVHDEIKRGMIITTGIITNDAIKYINTLPKDYNIELLEGEDIVRQYSYFHHRKYSTI